MNLVMLPEKSWCSSDSVVEEEMPPTNTLHKGQSLLIIKEKLHVNEGNNGRSATAPFRLKDFLPKRKKNTETEHKIC
jgi:hypothetical protein